MNTGKPCVELITQYGVPLLINDRIDVHLAVGASASSPSTKPLLRQETHIHIRVTRVTNVPASGSHGIHIGQTDMPLPLARTLLGPDAIIGLSVSTPSEAQLAVQQGADYVGIGPVWATGSKDVSAKVKLAPEGVGRVLEVLAGTGVEAVAIGESESRSPEDPNRTIPAPDRGPDQR
jgi:thiamine-phosphate diphosphorylase/hydroxyethylthiazole kinase